MNGVVISMCSRCLEIYDIEREMESLGTFLDVINEPGEFGMTDNYTAWRYTSLGERLSELWEIECSCGFIDISDI